MSTYQFDQWTVSGDLDERSRAWLQATRRGFLQSRGSDEDLDRWWATATQERQRWRQATRAPRSDQVAWEQHPVATFASLDRTITVGRSHGWGEPCQLVADFITDVTVRATDRRRGLLRRLMTDELVWAKQNGYALAALTASEGGIYGRFGFGVSHRVRTMELDCGPRFQLRREPGCQVEEVDAARSGELLMGLMDDFQVHHRGAHQRMGFHHDWLTGLWDWEKGAVSTTTRVAVALGDLGPCGAVVLDKGAKHDQVRVAMMIADGDAELALWQFVASLDMVNQATFRGWQEGSPLRSALVDPRAVSTTGDEDWTWLRILDVPAALRARDWDHSGAVTLQVQDAMGIADGCWRIVVTEGRAEVVSADPGDAEVVLDVEALAETYFGTTPLSVLLCAGRVSGDPLAVQRLGRVLAVDELPRNLVGF